MTVQEVQTARCQVRAPSYTPPPKPADCGLDWGADLILEVHSYFGCTGDTIRYDASAFSLAFNRTDWWDIGTDATYEDPAGPLAVLAYGKTLVVGHLRCTSTKAGVSCRDTAHGTGFVAAKDRYSLKP